MRCAVRQSQVVSPLRPSGPFSLAIWVGSIGGAALATDPDPNVTPPSAGRILRLSPKRGGALVLGRLNQGALVQINVVFGVVAASSITIQLWIFDTTQTKWVQLGGTQTRTPTGAATNLLGAVVDISLGEYGAKLFPQITANTLVQAMGYDFM